MEDWLKYWPVVVVVINALMLWAGWSMRKAFATKVDLDEVTKTLGKHGNRIGLIERDMQHLPTKDDMHNLKLELSEVVGELSEVRADYRHVMQQQGRIEAVLTRHRSEEHSLNSSN